MVDLGPCPRCGKPVERASTLGGLPDCLNGCRVDHRGEWDVARHGHMLRELQTLMRPDETKALPAAPSSRARPWAIARSWH